MPKLKTLRVRTRHVRSNSQTLVSYKLKITLLLAAVMLLVLGVYGVVQTRRLGGAHENSLEINLEQRLVGRITAGSLTHLDSKGRPCESLDTLLSTYGLELLQGESLRFTDAAGSEHPLSFDSRDCTQMFLVQNGKEWLLIQPDGTEQPISGLYVLSNPLETEE